MKAQFEPALHAFRGFAILTIVAVHAFGFIFFYAAHHNTGINVDVLDRANEVFFHGSTIYFALVSGILFSLVLSRRGWTAFFRSKLLNVVLPYVLMTCLFTWSHWTLAGKHTVFNGSMTHFLQRVWDNLLIGDGIFTFWYIPVLLVLYTATPLLAALMNHKTLTWLLIPVVLSPLFFSRVWPGISWTTFAYFIGVYTLGLFVGANYEKVLAIIKQHAVFIGLLGLISTVVLFFMYSFDIEMWGTISLRESTFYIQKLCFASLMLLLFKRYAGTTPGWLNTLGDYAFPIFFIHGYLLFEAYDLCIKSGIKASSISLLLLLCVIELGITLALCVLISKLFQRIFGHRSKQLIGA